MTRDFHPILLKIVVAAFKPHELKKIRGGELFS